MMNIIERKFTLFGFIFWPQDTFLFALAMLIVFIMIVVFTAIFGRVWCGWLCPQTVLLEMLFRKIEYFIEGDAREQRLLNEAPWTGPKWQKKIIKHSIFFGLSFVIGNLLLAYIIGSDALLEIINDPPAEHIKGLTIMVLFSLMFYGIFARFREQACTFICPYGRFQSVLLDENSIVVAYDHKRGESRNRFRRGQTRETRRTLNTGDCVDCRLCVQVCPTGIDIRNGTQMECVNCTACIDACDNVMSRIGLPTGLIRYASLNQIEQGKKKIEITPRIIAYCGILLALMAGLAFLLLSRADVETNLLRAPGSLVQTLDHNRFSNLYLVNIINKTTHDMPITLKLLAPDGKITVAGGTIKVPAENLIESAVVVELDGAIITQYKTPLRIGVFAGDREIDTIKTTFMGPERLRR